MRELRRIHLWVPELFRTRGGIQTYSDFLVRAVRAGFPEAECEVFSKHDLPGEAEGRNRPGLTYNCTGAWGVRARTAAYAAKVTAAAITRRPDLVIASHLNFGPAARYAKAVAGTPYYLSAHGVEAWGLEAPSLRRALRSADRVLAVSNYTRERLLAEQQLDPRRVTILPNTVDSDRFVPGPKPARVLEQFGLRADQPVILTVSRLVSSEQYKGYDKVIRALPQIRRAIPDVRYVLVGKGDDRPRVERLIAELGVTDCVTLAGFVPDEELADYYNLSDVFAMPSKREGFGIVFLEAMCCGKFSLGGNKDGAADALLGGRLGALVDPDDVAEVGATLVAILRGTYPHGLTHNPALLRRRVIETYGFDKFRLNLADQIQSVFAGEGSPVAGTAQAL